MVKTEITHESGVGFSFYEDTSKIRVSSVDESGTEHTDVYTIVSLDTIRCDEVKPAHYVSRDPQICAWIMAQFFSHLANRGYTKLIPADQQGLVTITPQNEWLDVHLVLTPDSTSKRAPVDVHFNLPRTLPV